MISFGENAFDYALKGQDSIQQKNFNQAIIELEHALRLDNRNNWIFGLLGRAYYSSGNMEKALTAFRQAVNLDDSDTYSRMMIDIIRQKSLSRSIKKQSKEPTHLEKQAIHEQKLILEKLQASQELGYQIKRIVIDPGHGGFDSGAVGPSGIQEKNIVLELALLLKKILDQKKNYKTFLTRTSDYYVPLSERTTIANQYQADLFISLHINASPNNSTTGCSTFYCAEKASSESAQQVAESENAVIQFDSEKSQSLNNKIDIEEILFFFERKLYWKTSAHLAEKFQKQFQHPLKNLGVHSANFYVLKNAKMPAVLFETGFISNATEESLLKQTQFQLYIVTVICQGLFRL
ncbi:MAG: N-acetylmuramoyl-L-alanine amidase [Desulfobacterales bacterium]|nr:N-acetylmuramoyl-L-alanine amidase [Desulfobacterales bacterium]